MLQPSYSTGTTSLIRTPPSIVCYCHKPLAGALLQLQQQTEHAQTTVSQEVEECVIGQEAVIQQPWNTPQQGGTQAVRHHHQPTLDTHTETRKISQLDPKM